MQNPVKFLLNTQASTDRFISNAIWGDCPLGSIAADPRIAEVFIDDFNDLPLAPTLTTQVAFGRYKAYAAGGCTISRVSAINSVEILGGALQISMDTDDDEASIAQAYPGFLLSGSGSTSGKLWFECCYTQNSIATNMASVFIGLAETEQWTLASNVPHTSGDTIDNSASAIGFRIEEDGLGVIDTVRSDRATSFTNIGDTEAGTMVAHTFRKFGMTYDPGRSTDCIRFYANNQLLTTKLSNAALTAFTNLDANALGLIWSVAADSAGTSFLGSMKWWQCIQLHPASGF